MIERIAEPVVSKSVMKPGCAFVRVIFTMVFFCASTVWAQRFEVLDLGVPPIEAQLAGSNTMLRMNVSVVREQLQRIATNKAEVLYLRVRVDRSKLKPAPTWQVFLAGSREGELGAPGPFYLGDLNLVNNAGIWSKTSTRRYAIKKAALRSILESDGNAVATFVLKPGGDPVKLASKPVKISDVGFELQREKTVSEKLISSRK
jgi:hypothetical protein